MAHWSVHKLHLTPTSFKFFNEQHLMNVVASEPIRSSNDHTIKYCTSHLLSQSIKTWTAQLCSTVAIVAKDVLFLPQPSLAFMIFSHAVELLFDCSCLCLSLCRNADVDRDIHRHSPVVLAPGRGEEWTVHCIEEAVGRLDPIGAGHQKPPSWNVECSTVVFSLISAFGQYLSSVASEGYCISCGKPLRADLFGRWLIRLRQNLSFVIIPLKIATIMC